MHTGRSYTDLELAVRNEAPVLCTSIISTTSKTQLLPKYRHRIERLAHLYATPEQTGKEHAKSVIYQHVAVKPVILCALELNFFRVANLLYAEIYDGLQLDF